MRVLHYQSNVVCYFVSHSPTVNKIVMFYLRFIFFYLSAFLPIHQSGIAQ